VIDKVSQVSMSSVGFVPRSPKGFLKMRHKSPSDWISRFQTSFWWFPRLRTKLHSRSLNIQIQGLGNFSHDEVRTNGTEVRRLSDEVWWLSDEVWRLSDEVRRLSAEVRRVSANNTEC